MSFREGHRSSRVTSVLVLTVAVGVLAGIFGYISARVETIEPAVPAAAGMVLLAADSTEHTDISGDPSPTTERAVDTAKLTRTVPLRMRALPLGRWSPPSVPLAVSCSRIGDTEPSRPAVSPAGRERLTQLCIARR